MKKNFLISIFVFIGFCFVWEIGSRQFVEYRFILPPLSSIGITLWQHSDIFIEHTLVTLREMAGGFTLALLVALPLAWIMYLYKSSRAILQPFFVVLQSVPMFTLAPLMVLWFGWSYMAIVIPTAIMIFLPLTMNVYQGLMSTPKSLLDYFHVHQANRWQTFLKLQLPWSLPHIFAGLRISAALAGIGAIAGEWAGAQKGLGVLMLKSRRVTDLEVTFGALFCLILISISLYGLIVFAENRYKRQPIKLFFSIVAISVLGFLAFVIPLEGPSSKSAVRLLLDWHPNSNHIPLYVGIKTKIFEKNGIDLEILEISDPSDTLPFLTSKKADLALYYMPDVIKANRRGADLAIVGTLIGQPLNSFIFRSREEIHSPRDLNDKIIGYSVTSSNTQVLDYLLSSSGVVPKQMVNVNFDLVPLLGSRQVDVIYGAFWNIEGEHLRSLGIETEHFSVSELGHPPYSELILVSKSGFSKADSIKKALQESIQFCKAYPDEAFNLYANCHPDKSSATLAWEKKAWLKTLPVLAEHQDPTQDVWYNLNNWLKKFQ